MSGLRLAVLGPPEVFHNESRLAFPLRKAQALLLYLAVEGGLHSRGKLATFLWPDSEPQVARKALRNALALLRHLLADPEASPAQPSHLLSSGELLGLDPQSPRELDLDVVQRAWNEAQRLTTPSSSEQRTALVTGVQHALALVRWLVFARLAEEACRRLMRVHLARGEASAALQVYATCRARLAEELRVKPSADTVALAEHIRATA